MGQLLGWILDGSIRIEYVTAERPQLYFRNRPLKCYLNEQGGRNRIFGGRRYRWSIKADGKVRRVVCSKLVWMYVERKTVPEGSHIHHGCFGSLYDGYFNLTCLTVEEHHAIHYGSSSQEDF